MNKFEPFALVQPELSLQPLCIEPRRRWLPVRPENLAALDTSCWLTRASRGYSWNRRGSCR